MSFRVKNTEYGPISERLLSANLSDLCVKKSGVQTGPFGSQLHREDYVEEGTPIITVEHLGDNRIVHENTPFVSDVDKERLSKYHLQEGDIVFSRVGSVDRRALVRKAEDGWLFSGRCLRVRVDKKKINSIYLSYFFGLEGFKNYIRSIAVGATMPSLNTKILSDIPVYYPESLADQEYIADLLYTLDEKIELNRQTNQTLEQIAQAIFKSWFVDFEPTRAKVITKAQGADPTTQELAAQAIISGAITLEQLQGYAEESVEESAQQREQESLSTRLQKAINEKLSQASAHPLNATTSEQLIATAALFPNELVESELGEVPEGWELKPFSEYAKVTKGKNITKKNAVPGNVPVVAGGLLPAYWHNAHNVEGPVITISASGANAGYVNLYNQNIWSSDSSYIDKKSTSYFYTAYVCLKYYQKAIYDMQTGAAQPHIYPKDFERLNVVFGSDKLLEQLENLLFSFFEKTANLTNEAETLTQIRDTLLPKLLSGEITLAEEVKRS